MFGTQNSDLFPHNYILLTPDAKTMRDLLAMNYVVHLLLLDNWPDFHAVAWWFNMGRTAMSTCIQVFLFQFLSTWSAATIKKKKQDQVEMFS